jgi:hypothetical protein
MQVELQLIGRTPYAQHNIRLANPDDQIVKAIRAITSKRVKTEEDRAEISRLEWYGGLYADDGGPYVPTANIRRCLNEAAKVRKLGKAVLRGVVMTELAARLEYDGPRDLDKLWSDTTYRLSMSVGVQGSRTMRTRPVFPAWSVTTQIELLTDVLDLDALADIANAAGLIEGLGDARLIGYGRFNAIVKGA